jgi:hypothetical protein
MIRNGMMEEGGTESGKIRISAVLVRITTRKTVAGVAI